MTCATGHTYSNSLQQSKPRMCLKCGEREADWKKPDVQPLTPGAYDPQDLPQHSDPDRRVKPDAPVVIAPQASAPKS